MSKVRSPRDCSMLTSGAGSFILGGRVATLSPGGFYVRDAWAQVHCRWVSEPAALAPGDLVLLRCRPEAGLILCQELLDRQGLSGSEPPPTLDLPDRTEAKSAAADGARVDCGPARMPGQRNSFADLLGQEQRHLATRRAGISRAEALAARAVARKAVRDFFEQHDFLEVETPVFAPCPGIDAHVQSLAAVSGQRGWLMTSPELHMKRLLVGGMPRIYQMARCFRGQEQGPLHEPEFTLLEWYRAHVGFEQVLADTEEIVRDVCVAVSGACDLVGPKPFGGGRAPTADASAPFERMTVRQAFAEFANEPDAVALAARDASRYFELLVEAVEPGLAALGVPVFLTHFPKTQAALARLCPDDPDVAERFELYACGVELCNGFGELTDAQEQRERFLAEQQRRRDADETVYPLPDRFLTALQEGMPPAAGNALGLDRLIALCLGGVPLSHTMAFPDAWR